MATSKTTRATDAIVNGLRERSLAKYPGAHLKSPWPGHLDLAVRDKTFAYLSVDGEPLGISCKLPRSNAVALMLPHTKPTEYGLGKSGWVSLKLPEGELPDVEMLEDWIDESYRAQAPKKLIAQLDAGSAAPAPATKKAATKKATKKAATKKAARTR